MKTLICNLIIITSLTTSVLVAGEAQKIGEEFETMETKVIKTPSKNLNKENIETDVFKEFNYEKTLNSEISQVLRDVRTIHNAKENNSILQQNKLIKEIEDRQRVKFVVKDYKKVDVFVRENYAILDDNYVLKNPSGWRRILIKQSNVWE